MTDIAAPSSDTTPPPDPSPTSSPSPSPPQLSDLDKIKAAQAARRTRRTRSTTQPPIPTTSPPDAPSDTSQLSTLEQQISTLRLEMASLRRNHLTNIKKVTDERDMFAAQLVREQQQSAGRHAFNPDESKRAQEMAAQLRAARSRSTDLEAENTDLRDQVKQLNFRVQAGKTLSAANDGYERIVDELVNVKLKCAQLQEEKEDLLKINRELMSTNAHFREQSGELEKSRSGWVVQCAELEKQRAQLEHKVKELQGMNNPDTSYKGADLQDVKL